MSAWEVTALVFGLAFLLCGLPFGYMAYVALSELNPGGDDGKP